MIHQNKIKPIFSGVRTIKRRVEVLKTSVECGLSENEMFSFCRQKYKSCLMSIKFNYRKPFSFFRENYLSFGFRGMYDMDGYRNTEPSSRVKRVLVQLNMANRTTWVFHG